MVSAVRGANALTARWAASLPDGATVLSGAGVWPLLAALAAGASGPGADELCAATGVPADEAMRGARELFEVLDESADARAALGLWTHRRLRLRPQWTEALPPASYGTLSGDASTDRPALDRWVADRTGGLLDRMPIELTPATVLVLASALSVRTRWVEPFTDDELWIADGPWASRAAVAGLSRATGDLRDVRVADTPSGQVTLLRVAGTGDVDVHLMRGEPRRTTSEVLAAGIAALDSPHPDGTALPDGATAPGLTVDTVASMSDEPQLTVQTVRFTVTAEHDLIRRPDLFGLTTVIDPRHGHFPNISPDPLAVNQARQDATATFSATGFEAAAITPIGAVCAGAPAHTVKQAHVRFDAPFGFAATHRETGLVLATGWVDHTESWPN